MYIYIYEPVTMVSQLYDDLYNFPKSILHCIFFFLELHCNFKLFALSIKKNYLFYFGKYLLNLIHKNIFKFCFHGKI